MKTLGLEDIRAHWQDWALKYGTQLRATTKTSTAKAVEIDALARAVRAVAEEKGSRLRILEIGCGNGQNCLSLARAFPEAAITGVDYIEAMIAAASELKAASAIGDERLLFRVGDVLDLDLPLAAFDIVFTDRCLINLNADELQQRAIASLAQCVDTGGYLLMLENSQNTYADQNAARESVGLPARTPAEFNHFFDETSLLPFLPTIGLELVDIEDFISLHDLVLYVLVPMVNGGAVDYDHPLVEAASRLNISLSALRANGLGAYGQNRLYKCRKLPL